VFSARKVPRGTADRVRLNTAKLTEILKRRNIGARAWEGRGGALPTGVRRPGAGAPIRRHVAPTRGRWSRRPGTASERKSSSRADECARERLQSEQPSPAGVVLIAALPELRATLRWA